MMQLPTPTWRFPQRIMGLGYGQSPSVGVGAQNALTVTQPFGNIQFLNDLRVPGIGDGVDMTGSEPLIERKGVVSGYSETGVAHACNAFVRHWQRLTGVAYPNQGFILHGATGGRSGMSMQQLSKGSPYYEEAQGFVSAAKALAIAMSMGFALGFMMFDHGERDTEFMTARRVYAKQGLIMERDFSLEAMSRAQSTMPPLWLAFQTSSWKRYWFNSGGMSSKRPEIALAQRDMARQSPNWKTIGPKYGFTHGSDHIHFPAESYLFRGEYYGRAAAETLFARLYGLPDPVVALDLVSDRWTDNIWQGWFDVPVAPLVWDTTDIAAVPNYGFDLRSPDGETLLTTEAVFLQPATNSVVCRFTGTPPVGARLQIAFGRDETGSGPTAGPRCQLRDSAGDRDAFVGPDGITRKPHNRVLHLETIKPDPAISAGSRM